MLRLNATHSRIVVLWLVGLPAVAMLPGTANGQLLGDTLDSPIMFFNNTGRTSFDASSGALTVDGQVLSFTFGGLDPAALPSLSLSAQLDGSGSPVGGTLQDLIVAGSIDVNADGTAEYSGTLLTGRVTAFGYVNLDPAPFDAYDFRFETTGGSLAGVYGLRGGVQVFSENSNFHGSFDEDFGGTAKGNLGAITSETYLEPWTPGYWKNHREAWAVDELTIGGVTYDDEQLMNLLCNRTADGRKAAKDITVKLAKFLVAAKLSLLADADPLDIVDLIVDSDVFLSTHGLGGMLPASLADEAEFLKNGLDDYLNHVGFDGTTSLGAFTIGTVPEPTTLALLSAGAVALLRRRRRR